MAGVSTRTVTRRMDDPAFREELAGLRKQSLEQAAISLSTRTPEAIQKLRDLMDSGDHRVALGAAKALLDFNLRFADAAGTAREIEKLRADIAEITGAAA